MKKYLLLQLVIFLGYTLQAQYSCDFAGKWDTFFDGGIILCKLTMQKTYGNVMTGTYHYESNNGTVSGFLQGSIFEEVTEGKNIIIKMKGTWTEGKTTGTFRFITSCGGGVLSGTYINDNTKQTGKWIGKKQ